MALKMKNVQWLSRSIINWNIKLRLKTKVCWVIRVGKEGRTTLHLG